MSEELQVKVKQYLGSDAVLAQVTEEISNVRDNNRGNQVEADEIVGGVPSPHPVSSSVYARDSKKNGVRKMRNEIKRKLRGLMPTTMDSFVRRTSSTSEAVLGPRPRACPSYSRNFQRTRNKKG